MWKRFWKFPNPKSLKNVEPTPQGAGDETQHTPLRKRILQELTALQKLEQLYPQNNRESLEQFLSKFEWNDSTINIEARKAIEKLLFEFLDTFSRQRFDIGINIDFKVK